MNFSVFNNKKVLDNGEVRMIVPSILFADIENSTFENREVQADEVGRVDLISLREYGGDWYGDLILKFNNISNPFSFNEGDILKIPAKDTIMSHWKEVSGTEATNNVKSQFIDSKRLTEKDAKRVEYLAKKAQGKANGSSQIIPPNIVKHGESNIKVGNGKISLNPVRKSKKPKKSTLPQVSERNANSGGSDSSKNTRR